MFSIPLPPRRVGRQGSSPGGQSRVYPNYVSGKHCYSTPIPWEVSGPWQNYNLTYILSLLLFTPRPSTVSQMVSWSVHRHLRRPTDDTRSVVRVTTLVFLLVRYKKRGLPLFLNRHHFSPLGVNGALHFGQSPIGTGNVCTYVHTRTRAHKRQIVSYAISRTSRTR